MQANVWSKRAGNGPCTSHCTSREPHRVTAGGSTCNDESTCTAARNGVSTPRHHNNTLREHTPCQHRASRPCSSLPTLALLSCQQLHHGAQSRWYSHLDLPLLQQVTTLLSTPRPATQVTTNCPAAQSTSCTSTCQHGGLCTSCGCISNQACTAQLVSTHIFKHTGTMCLAMAHTNIPWQSIFIVIPELIIVTVCRALPLIRTSRAST